MNELYSKMGSCVASISPGITFRSRVFSVLCYLIFSFSLGLHVRTCYASGSSKVSKPFSNECSKTLQEYESLLKNTRVYITERYTNSRYTVDGGVAIPEFIDRIVVGNNDENKFKTRSWKLEHMWYYGFPLGRGEPLVVDTNDNYNIYVKICSNKDPPRACVIISEHIHGIDAYSTDIKSEYDKKTWFSFAASGLCLKDVAELMYIYASVYTERRELVDIDTEKSTTGQDGTNSLMENVTIIVPTDPKTTIDFYCEDGTLNHVTCGPPHNQYDINGAEYVDLSRRILTFFHNSESKGEYINSKGSTTAKDDINYNMQRVGEYQLVEDATCLKLTSVTNNTNNAETIIISCHSYIDTCAAALDYVAEHIKSPA